MAELNVSKKSIRQLFEEMRGKKFVVPDYQRAYAWDREICETLWLDLINFFDDSKANKQENYYLGAIVTYQSKEAENEIEIIDGQQRITSLFLLLRVFYKKLDEMTDDEDVNHLKGNIASCLWDIDEISGTVIDFGKIHIESRVATEEQRDALHEILVNGTVANGKTRYSENFENFLQWNNEFAAKESLHWKELVVTVLNRCVIFPIECDSVDLALTIFTTLNDRGLQLNDSDIFKAQMYKNKATDEEKSQFIETWKELTEITNDNTPIDDLFRYYSHVIRAQEKNSSKEIGLRKFYERSNYRILQKPETLDDIVKLGDFWTSNFPLASPTSKKNQAIEYECKKYLHCLTVYPNEFWKYLVSVYVHKELSKEGLIFSKSFLFFLKKITAFLFARYVERPGVNAIKDEVYRACIAIYHDQEIKLEIKLNEHQLKERFEPDSRIAKGLILLHAYLHKKQKQLLPLNFQVEHIFPKKWQDTNYKGWTKKSAEEYLEKFGNKAAIEKKINIQAGNEYFGRKKDKYKKSKVQVIKSLSQITSNDWVKSNIEDRDAKFKNDIVNFLKDNVSMK